MKLLNTLILTLLLTNSAFAQNAVKLKSGEAAPFAGVLLTEERATEAVKAEKSNIVLKDLRATQDELIDYHKDNARLYRKRLAEAKFNSFWTNTGFFVLGVFLTGFAFKVNQKVGDL